MVLLLAATSSVFAQDSLFISEVADPQDDYTARFVELYNSGSEAVDFSTVAVWLARQANGSSWDSIQLAGTVAAGSTFVIATDSASFNTAFGFDPDLDFSGLTGNGDDGYYLFTDGGPVTGTLIEAYGAIDVDGTGEAWEYLDSRALRVGGITVPNATWTATEWEITPAVVADFTPGTHDTAVVVDTVAPVWADGYPSVNNIKDTQFDIVAQLDETSTVYYVVLEGGATAPTVEEVKAGTGSAGATAVVASAFSAGLSETLETVSGLVVETAYDLYLVAEDDEDVPNIQDTVTTLDLITVIVPDVIVRAGFDADLTPFTQVSILGAQTWVQASYSGNGYAKASGYSGGAQDNDDYLVSPAIDLNGSNNNMLSFITAVNFAGPALQVWISTDFSGTYDSASVVDAVWTDLTSEFTYSGGSYAWAESGEFDLSSYSGTVYIAFRYLSNPTDGASTWEVDDFMVTGFMVEESDATLSELMVDDVALEGFDPATLSYTVDLPAGTTTVPVVTATTNNPGATATITDATDLTGDLAARSATISVLAADGTTTQDYTVVFSPLIEVANLGELRSLADETRTFLVTGEAVLTFQQSYRNKKYVQDATGGVEIDDSPGSITTTYAVGDGITGLKGTVEDYNGLLQFHPTADAGAATSTGNAIVPTEVTPAEINASIDTYESTVVMLSGVTIADADGIVLFEDGKNYSISGAAESMQLRVHFYGTTLTGTVIPDSANVIGIVLEYKGSAQVAPRSADDVEALESSVGVARDLIGGIEVYPVPASDQLFVRNAKQVRSVTLYSITGAAVMQQDHDGSSLISIDISRLHSGVYMIRMETSTTMEILRFVKQ